MKRLFVSAAVLPFLYAVPALAQTKITTETTTPVTTAAIANGAPDNLTIDTTGTIKPTAAGAAVTVNSNNTVINGGVISFNNLSASTGVLVQGGFAGTVSNTGSIILGEDYTQTDADSDGDLDGALASGSGRVGIDVTGPFTGDIRNDAGTITIKGNDSAGIHVQGVLTGNLVNSGTITVIGDRTVGISANNVVGDVTLTGATTVQGGGAIGVSLGDVAGGVKIQGGVSATGYGSTIRLTDAARAKLDADDLKQGGSAVRITGSVGRGVLLDAPPADTNADNTDEDADGVPDAAEGTAAVSVFGSAPAIDIGGPAATTLGAVGTGDYGYGLVVRGGVTANGVNDGAAATAIRIGQDGGGSTTVAGGINILGGTVSAQAYGADVTADGGAATAILINSGSVVSSIRNTGAIQAALVGGSQDARAIVDLSGSVSLVENLGLISATATPKAGSSNLGQTIAIDLRANTTGAVVRQTLATSTSTPSIVGDVLMGSGNDRVELLGGTLKGALDFGGGADALVIDNGASASGRLTDADGNLSLDIINGRLAISNTSALQASSLNIGAKGVLAVAIDPTAGTATHFNVAGQATVATGAQFELTLNSLLRGPATYEIIHAGSLSFGDASAALVGSPYLYLANLQANTQAGTVSVDLRPKTVTELGLSGSAAAAYPAVFNALDKDARIETAILGAGSKDAFTAIYDQMLPDHSGAALMSAQTISGAISQAVNRPSIRDVSDDGGMWAQEIVFRLDHDREQAMGFRSQGFGLATGVETVGLMNAIGLSASFVTTDYHDKGAASGEQVAMNFFEGGAYWRFEAGGLKADLRGGLGYVRFDSERLLVDSAASLNLRADAKWSGWLADAHAGVSYQLNAGAFYARPELSADYLRLNEGDYQESGGGEGFDLGVDKRHGDLMTGQALLALGARFGDKAFWAPEIKFGWRTKLAGDPGSTTARFTGGSDFTLNPEDIAGGGLIARAGVRGGTDYMLMSVDGGGVFDDNYREYDIHATVRFKF